MFIMKKRTTVHDKHYFTVLLLYDSILINEYKNDNTEKSRETLDNFTKFATSSNAG